MFGKTKIVIKINGMDCEHCAHHVKTAIENLDGVDKVAVNLRKGEASVTLSKNNPATVEIISQTVKDIGFTPVL